MFLWFSYDKNVAPDSYSNMVHNADNISIQHFFHISVHLLDTRRHCSERASYTYRQTLPSNIIDYYLGCFCSFRLRHIVTFT